jgi:hypothetical protein
MIARRSNQRESYLQKFLEMPLREISLYLALRSTNARRHRQHTSIGLLFYTRINCRGQMSMHAKRICDLERGRWGSPLTREDKLSLGANKDT